MSQVPLHFTKAVFLAEVSALTPIISPIAAAAFAPPTGQPFTGALPVAIASAKASQPAKPQPPQLAPGSASLIESILGSLSTLNLIAAIPSMIPKRTPKPPTTSIGNNIAFNIVFSSS